MMRSSNPVMNAAFTRARGFSGEGQMTVQGTVNKAGIALALLLVAASWAWGRTTAMGAMPGLAGGAAIAGFIVAMVTVFNMRWAPVTTPIYAVLKGLFLGSISAFFGMAYEGIVFQAVMLTAGVFAAMLFLYTSRIIQVTQRFRMMVVAATGGVLFLYLMSLVLGFFGIQMSFLHQSGGLGIGISLVIVAIAAFNLALDFDFIERGSTSGAPKVMEWYGAFGLLVTLVWLYIEILRLLAVLSGRR